MTMTISNVLIFAVIFLACSISVTVEGCSCPFNTPTRRSESLRNGVCRGDVYVATVTGAMCNCLPDDGEIQIIKCQDYQFQDTDSREMINIELTSRGLCEIAESRTFFDAIHNCSVLTGGLIPAQGYSVQGPSNTSLPPLQNISRSYGSYSYCYLSCPFNYPDNSLEYGNQPCLYNLTVTEVIKGNYSAGDTVTLPGPDVLTSCGNPQALLKINEQYVVGVGSVCEPISAWSLLQSYPSDDIQQLRELSQSFESGRLKCGAFGFVPSFILVISIASFLVIYHHLV